MFRHSRHRLGHLLPPPTPFAPFQDPTIHASYLIEGFGVSMSPLWGPYDPAGRKEGSRRSGTAGTAWDTSLPPHPLCPLPGPNNSRFLSYRGVWGLCPPFGVPMIQLGERREAGSRAQQAAFGPPLPPPTPFPLLPGPNNSHFPFYRGVWGLSIPPGVPMSQLGKRKRAGGKPGLTFPFIELLQPIFEGLSQVSCNPFWHRFGVPAPSSVPP